MKRVVVLVVVLLFVWISRANSAEPLRVATFQIDATPPLGAPLCDGLVIPAAKIDDKLSARGIILLGAEKPIVLCAIDWVGIGNSGQTAFQQAFADAVKTTPDRVAVHTLHQHDAPGCDFAAEELLATRGVAGKQFDVAHARRTIDELAKAARASLEKAEPVTHVGVGKGRVEKFASNRRVLGTDGKVQYVRMSSCRNAAAIAAPEGTIDPDVRLVTLWRDDRPVAVLSYYATHPQSHYGKGAVSADTVGLARSLREKASPGPAYLHFNGAGGNVAAGKYNDGAPANRAILAERLAAGMKEAWEKTKRTPIVASDVAWTTRGVKLPPSDGLVEEGLLKTLDNNKSTEKERVRAARDLVWLRRCKAGDAIDVGCLKLGTTHVLHLPGELFVEYQLVAQAMRPNDFVAVAAYGDYGPGYIGTRIAYGQGGYETGYVSRVSPDAEKVLTTAMRELLAD